MDIFEQLVSQRTSNKSVDLKENVIEFLQHDSVATFTLSNARYVNRIKKLKESHPDDVDISFENQDGTIVGHVPLSWIKINPPKKLSEEHREKLRMLRVNSFRKSSG